MTLKRISAAFLIALLFTSCNVLKSNVSDIGNPQVEDKRWKLVELYGKPVSESAETHYIIFHSKDKKLEAKAGCNMLLNPYKISNQYQLGITPGISTRMACPDSLENDLIKAMAEADNFSVSETNLSLNKARMAPLARFELSE